MSRRKGIIVILLLFAGSVLLRLPNLNRPLSKHHEYNTAVILMNIESWRDGGGGWRYHYVPLLNYQHPGDKCTADLPQVDASGNILYLSFGPGWYVIPYFIYQVFHLPVEAVYLQVINLFFDLAAVLLLFLLCERLFPQGRSRRYESIVMACTLFMFSPGVLWYLGNGYVTTGIEMPFVFAALWVLIPMLQSPGEIRLGRCLLLSLLIIVLAYIDWFVLFLSLVTCLWILLRVRKDKRYAPLLFVVAASTLAAVALPMLQFASYAGVEKLVLCLKHQFLFRSIANKRASHLRLAGHVVGHIASSYLPMLVLLCAAFVLLLLRKIKISMGTGEWIFVVIYTSALLLYNVIFLEWSSVHEFALMPLSLLLAVLTARLTMMAAGPKRFYVVLSAYVIIACLQYYQINPPGRTARSGLSYDSYQKLGQQLRNVPADEKIFMDGSWTVVIDYYAHRNITTVKSIDSARAYMQRWGVEKAVWVEQRDYKLEKIVRLP